ncbi:MAG: L-serine ammonia-lyase, partial [Erysipelotrichaceae bacterium]|nr:L-serine ammonia-lyase [Erysipelotrichaceae bacterium]
MQAIRQLYKIGYGPSSSHTIAPYRIAQYYRHAYPQCTSYEVVLGGSLALTAKGHGTIGILEKALETQNIDIRYDIECRNNVVNICGKDDTHEYPLWHGLSLGGGAVSIEEFDCGDQKEVYPENSFEEIKKILKEKNITLL